MVEIFVNNQSIDIEEKAQGIKYSMQINDIFDISSVNASYTNSFSIPKNAKNTQIFQMLGLVGDSSRVPYDKVEARLSENGFPIIKSGWLKISETSTNYKISIIDGIIDFFKAIDNKNLGRDVDISELDHTKDLDTVIASFTNDYYKYIVAEYNGKTLGVAVDGTPAYNIDYLVPSAKVTYLWNRIFETFGFTYSGSIFEDENFTDLWLTYPKAPEAEGIVSPVLYAGFEKLNYVSGFLDSGQEFTDARFWNFANIIEGTSPDGWTYVIPTTGNYRLRVRPKGYVFQSGLGFNAQAPIEVRVYRGANIVMTANTSSEEEIDQTYDNYFYEGEVIRLAFYSPEAPSLVFTTRLYHENTKFDIYSLSFGDVSFTQALAEFSVKDFIKEIIWRFGLTPVIDNMTKHITFYTIAERYDISNVIDWSSKYVSRDKESYIQGSYAQQNTFKHKYNDQEANFNNGYLYISNQNLEDNKDIATSKTYSFDERVVQLPGVNSFVYPIWQPEPKEVTNDEGETEIVVEYKGLSGRFYMMKYKETLNLTYFISETLGGEIAVPLWPYVYAENTVFSDVIPIYYEQFERVLNDFRLHEITLALTVTDIMFLNFVVPYYFAQEANYYLLNKVTWESGKLSKAEFIRLKRQ